MKALSTYGTRSVLRRGGAILIVLAILPVPGCVAQQTDLKQTEKPLQQRMRQSDDQLAQTRARQSLEISSLQDEELSRLKGQLEQVMHQTQELQAKQENLKYRSAQLERQVKRLEQLSGQLERQVKRSEQLSGQTARPLENVTNPPSKSIDARRDSQVELFSSILAQIADLSRRIRAIENK